MSEFEKIFKKLKQAETLDIKQIQGLLELMVKTKLNHLEEEELFCLIVENSTFNKTAIKKEYSRVRADIIFHPKCVT